VLGRGHGTRCRCRGDLSRIASSHGMTSLPPCPSSISPPRARASGYRHLGLRSRSRRKAVGCVEILHGVLVESEMFLDHPSPSATESVAAEMPIVIRVPTGQPSVAKIPDCRERSSAVVSDRKRRQCSKARSSGRPSAARPPSNKFFDTKFPHDRDALLTAGWPCPQATASRAERSRYHRMVLNAGTSLIEKSTLSCRTRRRVCPRVAAVAASPSHCA